MPCSLLFYVFFFNYIFFNANAKCNFHLHGCIYAQAQLTTERSALTELRANRRIVCSLILRLHGHRDISAQTFTHSLIHHITHIQTHSPIHTHVCAPVCICVLVGTVHSQGTRTHRHGATTQIAFPRPRPYLTDRHSAPPPTDPLTARPGGRPTLASQDYPRLEAPPAQCVDYPALGGSGVFWGRAALPRWKRCGGTSRPGRPRWPESGPRCRRSAARWPRRRPGAGVAPVVVGPLSGGGVLEGGILQFPHKFPISPSFSSIFSLFLPQEA